LLSVCCATPRRAWPRNASGCKDALDQKHATWIEHVLAQAKRDVQDKERAVSAWENAEAELRETRAALEARTPPGEWYSRAALDHAVAEAVGAEREHRDALVRELRDALGLFSGAMPVPPKQAWDEAIALVRQRAEAGRSPQSSVGAGEERG
jgi:hypothetical protein